MTELKQRKSHAYKCMKCKRWWRRNLWELWKYVDQPKYQITKIKYCPECDRVEKGVMLTSLNDHEKTQTFKYTKNKKEVSAKKRKNQRRNTHAI